MSYNPRSLPNLDQTTHGMYGTPTYKSWQAMLRRVKSADKAKWYSHLRVCYRWRTFENFYADMGDRPAGATLDRINNSKGYEPSNCRWATRQQQANNKRDNVVLEHDGKRQCVAAWARDIGVKRQTLHKRLRAGWPVDRVLTGRMFHEAKGKRKTA